jgi:hypothetical protein
MALEQRVRELNKDSERVRMVVDYIKAVAEGRAQ